MTDLTTGRSPSLAFVIPAHNEQECIDEVISQALFELDDLKLEGEVLVVDDASSDATGDIVRARRNLDSRVRLSRTAKNIGPQRCIVWGFGDTSADAVFFIPADLQLLAREVRKCLPLLGEADFVCTDRQLRRDALVRRAMSGAFNALVRSTLDLPFSDIDSGLFVTRRVLNVVLPQLGAEGDFLQAELVARALAAGFVGREVVVDHFPRAGGRASAMSPRLIATTLKDFVRLGRRLRQLRRTSLE